MISYKLPDSVKIVLNRLETNGFEAFVVGGYVRDLLLGRETHDCDVTAKVVLGGDDKWKVYDLELS